MKTLYLLFIIILSSCTYPCAKSDGLSTNFISFSERDIQSFIIKKYVKGSRFSSFVDSLVVDSSVAGFVRKNDTLDLVYSRGKLRLTSDFDYRVLLPAANITYDITEIEEPQTEGKKSNKKKLCVNKIVSCRVNGQFNPIINYNMLYLKK